MLSKSTVFNIDNNKKNLEKQISILEESYDTEDCWKFSFAITGINYCLK